MDKNQIAAIFNEIGLLLEIKGENIFKARAYYNGARIIDTFQGDIGTLIREGREKDIQGIGPALSDKLKELVVTGKLEYYERLKKEIPDGLIEMLRIPGLGPRKINMLYRELGIETMEELEISCVNNRLVQLPGFGDKTQQRILKGIEYLRYFKGSFLYGVIIEQANMLIDDLKSNGYVKRCSLAGSLRRRKETVKDMDIIASSNDSHGVMECFVSHHRVKEITSSGPTKSSIVLDTGMAADIRVVDDSQFPYALHHFTGSKEHNTALRHRAKQMGIKINEYGLFKKDKLLECKDEAEFFEVLGLDYIQPELRENMGEIEAAENGTLPQLIKYKDIRGCFHVHSNYSDGLNSIEEIAAYAKKMGYEYVGISDHSKSAGYAGGLRLDDILRQHEDIDKLNDTLQGIKIYKGIECDILADGRLDYDDSILEKFDFVIGSVHSHFNMDSQKMTERILKALGNRFLTILGHLTGRLLLVREGYQVDIPQVIYNAAEENVIIEINSNPHRLDLDWRFCKFAAEKGVIMSIEPDAHDLKDFHDIRFGVNTARKGWLEKDDVLNTRLTEFVESYLKTSNKEK